MKKETSQVASELIESLDSHLDDERISTPFFPTTSAFGALVQPDTNEEATTIMRTIIAVIGLNCICLCKW